MICSSKLPLEEMEVAVEATRSSREEKASRRNRRRREKIESEKFEEEEEELLDGDEADQEDWLSHRRYWENYLAQHYGSCEDTTSVGPMRFTEGPVPKYASPDHALQIVSIQVTEAKDGLEWPLHVYGWVATRDSVDRKRNFLFNRTRQNCQVLTQKDSYLLLTGPSRAVVLVGQVCFEVELKVKGEKESEDKLLSLKFFFHHMAPCYGHKADMIRRFLSSKHSTIEVAYAPLHETVEATIASVRVIDGSWPHNLRGLVVCRTNIAKGAIVLLDSRDGRMPITYDREIELSRRVVSVEVRHLLIVDVVGSLVHDKSDVIVADRVVFVSKNAGYSYGTCDLRFCMVEITVAWSVFAIPGLEDMVCSSSVEGDGTDGP